MFGIQLMFVSLHRYIYSGTISIEELNMHDILALLVAIDELQLSTLLEHIQDELIINHNDIIEQHVIEIFNTTANLASCKILYEHCQLVISANPEVPLNADDSTELNHEVLKSLLHQTHLIMDEINIWKNTYQLGKCTHCWTLCPSQHLVP